MVDISTTIGSLRIKNPTMLASGIMDEDAGSMHRMIRSGAGAIVTKSIGLHAREGYPNPTVLELEYGLLNAMGLPNPGIDAYEDELQLLKKSRVPIIGSIYGATPDEFARLADTMQHCGAAAVELNVSCPHAKHYGMEVGCDTQLLYKIVTAVTEQVTIPVFVKISPNVTNIVEIASAAEQGNADAIVAINTVKAMKIDLETRQPILANKTGGYSGRAIKPIGVRCIYDLAQHIKLPLIGVGGITTGQDAVEYFMAGASAVQLGSAVYYRGPDVFRAVCTELKDWMSAHGYTNVSQLVGAALP
ncbi:MAG: dihydroorotate dehydrogenase [Candidatus Thermoplasmatota archaeon]|nr:dihydroorotate dehydrogenase [Candidatus Thermoplasmatota archaeon]